MKIRKLGDKKPNIVIFQGSTRDKDTCPNMESKTSKIVKYIVSKWSPFAKFTVIDLSINQSKKSIIQPCKGCVSTAGGFHCHFPCDCYKKNDPEKPDLMHDAGIYDLLKECDAFMVVSPIHWHSLTSQVKALFDRLVCINLTLTTEDARKMLGDDFKEADDTGELMKSGKYNDMLRNHLEGKVAAFYAHGDNGASDYEGMDLPESYDILDDGFGKNPKNTVMPFVMQLKYSGVFVPNELIEAFYINEGIDYYTANKLMRKEKKFKERADALMENLLDYLDEIS